MGGWGRSPRIAHCCIEATAKSEVGRFDEQARGGLAQSLSVAGTAEKIVHRARDALARQDWAEAYSSLSPLEPSLSDDTQALEAFADAAWWLGKLDECITARERAYAHFEAEGDTRGGARSAILLYDYYCFKGRRAVANGWLQRAKRLLDGQPEAPEHGTLFEREAEVANGSGALELALEKAGRALEVGRRLRNADVEADALQCKGRLLISLGKPADGLALFDEAMLLGAEGRLGVFVVGKVYCSLISVCDELGDVQRAAEWTEVGSEWARTHQSTFFPGLCRVHHAELLKLKGAWAQAEVEARRACAELAELHVFNAGAAFYEVGEIRRRMCDFEGAEAEFRRAEELGFEPQPGLALLRLAQGRIDLALRSISTAVADVTWNRLARGKLLPAQVEIAIAAGALDVARAAIDELAVIADTYPTPWLLGVVDYAEGQLALAAGEPETACGRLRRALDRWQMLDLPYEMATTRRLLGSAYATVGDEEAAAASFRAAQAIFEGLGADAECAQLLTLQTGASSLPCGLTAREAEVLCLVASGSTNKQMASDLGLSEKTIARHLSNIFTKIGVSSRSAATAFAFEHQIVGRNS
jgi:DNA-binding CsgD family transcriptional regulator/tetratricopeptide (TPR) repeat protein